ncbi:MAG: hemolysin family protein [Candidatus Hydrogenedens sp.]|nr:hemolysin family protein [Candidatus Hydrogenedens sp.]
MLNFFGMYDTIEKEGSINIRRRKENQKNIQINRQHLYPIAFCFILIFLAMFQAESVNGGTIYNNLDKFFPFHIIILSCCLLTSSAFFSATETAFFSIRTTQLKAMKNSPSFRDRMIAQLMKSPSELLTTILMGNAIVNIGLSIAFGSRLEEYIINRVLPSSIASSFVSYSIACLASTLLLIFGGEVTPKLIASRYVEQYARSVVFLIFIIHALFTPIRRLLLFSIGITFRITHFSSIPPSPWVTDDELKLLVNEEGLSNVIAEDERKMIRSILEFRDEPVKRILVPRTEIVAIQDTATVADAWEVFCEHEYSRMPIYHENLDHIIGILYAKDLLDYTERGQWKQPVKPIGRKANFIPDTMSISELIKTAQKLNTHVAIVVDEYGGTAGLVTLHDALSAIVGEISDDESVEEPLFVKISENEYLLHGKMPISELEELIQYSLEDPEHNTIAGYLLKQHENLTKQGDIVSVGPLKFTVEKMDGKRITQLRLNIEREADTQETEGNNL